MTMFPIEGWPFKHPPTRVWEVGVHRFALVKLPGHTLPNLPAGMSLPRTITDGYYCGYAIFDHRPVQEPGNNGIITYVPVHGGITLAQELSDGSMMYGFDCGHAGDEDRPELRDEEWLGAECQRMTVAIEIAAKYEAEFLEAGEDNAAKAFVLGQYHGALRKVNLNFNLTDNFGAMINVLGGKL